MLIHFLILLAIERGLTCERREAEQVIAVAASNWSLVGAVEKAVAI